MSFRGQISDVFSIVAAQSLFLLSGLVRVFGVNKFFSKKLKNECLVASVTYAIIYIFLLSFFRYFNDSIFIRTLIIGFTLSTLSIITGVIIIKNRPSYGQLSYFFMGIIFFFFSLVFISRLVAWIFFPDIRELFKSSFFNNLQFISNMLVDIIWTFMFFVIINQKLNRELSDSEAEKNAILNGISDNIAFVNENLEIIWANKAASSSLNKDTKDMIGRKCHELWAKPEKPCLECPTVKVFKTKKREKIVIQTPDGKIWNEMGEPVFNNQGELIGVVEIAQDITEFKTIENELKKSIAEKEILLKELHHRTKNNMHIIMSFLNIQARNLEDKKSLSIIKSAISRIQSMSLVHQKLYNSINLSSVDLKDYIESLINQIVVSYNDNQNVKISYDIDRVFLNIDKSITIGLVINEIVTNIFKYAFPDNRKG
ncbi:MAG TPA: histidine kinase dimerization/phosphoacceptor domain -containing protein, partial [Spirochaetota bacterium]|nr:histidine kinase dimerization/phosphoacceptor domain -containing protein [Spirochaetota bacterium]